MSRLQMYLQDFFSLRRREKVAILIVLFLAFVGGAMFWSTIKKNNTDGLETAADVVQKEEISIEPSPVFQLSVDPKTVQPLQTFTIYISIHPDTAVPESVDVVLRFHPGRVLPLAVEEGGIYRIYTKNEIGDNTISVSATDPVTTDAAGSIILAKVLMQALDTPDTVFLSPDPEKTAVYVDGENVLASAVLSDIAVRIE